jgi:hypothetical protein
VVASRSSDPEDRNTAMNILLSEVDKAIRGFYPGA